MKTKLIFACFLTLSATSLFAQEENLKDIYKNVTTAINTSLITRSGSVEISGFLSYNKYDTQYNDNEKITQQVLLIEPAIAYFIINNLSFGLDLSYLNQKTKSSGLTQSVKQTSIGPLAKYYIGKKRLRPFIQADYLFLTGDNYEGGELDFGAGILYHVTGNIGLSLFGKYGIISSAKENIDSQNRIFVGIGLANFIF